MIQSFTDRDTAQLFREEKNRRFGAFFAQTPEFWHGLQVDCDFRALAKQSRRFTAKVTSARELMTA